MKNYDKYKETLDLLVVILAILAFIVSTADYLKDKYKTTEIEKNKIKERFDDFYIKSAVFLTFIFLLYFINKDFLIKQSWIITWTKFFAIYIAFFLYGSYLQLIYHWDWLGKILYYSTIDEGKIVTLFYPGNIAIYLRFILFIGYIIISVINLLKKLIEKY